MTDLVAAGRRRRRCDRPWWAGWIRACAVVAGFLVATLGSGTPGMAAGAGSPARLVAAPTAAPDDDYVTRLRFDVSSIDPTLVTSSGPSTLTITGRMTNTGPDELVNLTYRFQRGDALRSTAEVHDEIAMPSEPTAKVPGTFTTITGTLAAGASAPFAFTTSLTGANDLDIARPGVYPVMVNVNGAVVLPAGPLEARIGELHLLLTVMGVPGHPAPTVPAGRPTPFNFVWPVVDDPHLGVDGVFLNDDLLASISAGGRLATLLDGLTTNATAALPAGALTVVIDPQLIDELDRMSGPYRVVAPPGAAQPPVTAIVEGPGSGPDATESSTGVAEPTPPTGGPAIPGGGLAGSGEVDVPGTVAGTGQRVAASYLERLRAVAAAHPVVLLPYGDPDVVALTRAGMTGQVSATQQYGQEVARRVWGDLGSVTAEAAAATAFPIDGAADGATLSTLIAGGARTGLLSQASVDVPTAADGRPTTSALIGSDDAGQVLPSVVAQTDVLGGLDKLIDEKRQTGWVTKVNSLTALLAQQRADGTTTPTVFAPTRRWSPDDAGLAGLVQLLGELGRSGVISGESLATLSAAAKRSGTTDYPQAARDRELPAEYLRRIEADRTAVAGLRGTLTSVDQRSDPAAVLDPLDEALNVAGSTAFRTDPTVGEANLTTIESTVSTIRSGVQIADSSTNYTLASSTSPLVLTVQNSTPYDVPVVVALTGGEMVGLTTTDQPVQLIPAGRSQQVKIPTEVIRSGQFQVQATLVGPDGAIWGNPVQLSVQSSAYGALTVILIAGAGGVLVIMVALRIRQRLRGRRARIAAAGNPTKAPATPATNPPAGPPSSGDPLGTTHRPASTTGEPRLVPEPPPGGRATNRQEFRS